ncbi:hypothetical protein JTY60_01710 [symbiont of Argiope bruennichi]|uniref:hypothetical protein n=1 Tax=symbiont of Argiope bruennichi TaxID=2810479 RepID=UPI003DA5A2F2
MLGKDIEKNYSSLMSILPSQLNLDKKYNFLTSINNFNFVGNEKYNFAGTSESDNGQSLKVFHGDIKDGLLFNFYTTDYNATFQGLSWWKILLIVVGVIAAIIAIAFGFYNAASYFGWVGGEAAAAGAESAGAGGAAGAAAGDAAGVLDRLEIYGREWLAARRDIDALGPTWANGSPWATGTAGGAAGAEGAVGGVSEGAAGGAMADAEGAVGGVSEGAAGGAMADAEGAAGGASGGFSESAITGSEGETASGAGANEELEGISEEEAENNSSSFRDKLEEKGKDFFNDLKKGYKSGKKGFRSFRKGTSKFGKKIYKQGKNYFREKTGKTNKNDLENAVGKGGKNKPDYEPSTSGTSRQNVQSGGGNSNLNRGITANNTGKRTYVYGENSDFSTPDNVTTHLSPGGSSDPYKFEWDPFQNH